MKATMMNTHTPITPVSNDNDAELAAMRAELSRRLNSPSELAQNALNRDRAASRHLLTEEPMLAALRSLRLVYLALLDYHQQAIDCEGGRGSIDLLDYAIEQAVAAGDDLRDAFYGEGDFAAA